MKKVLFTLLLTLIFVLCGCNEDEPIPNQSLYVGETYTIPSKGEWISENINIADVEGLIVKGIRIGDVVIRNNAQSFTVTVKPKTLFFRDFDAPCLQFGADAQTVKKYMNTSELISEADGAIYYKIEGRVPGNFSYHFENSKLKKVEYISCTIDPYQHMRNELIQYLRERYVFTMHENDDYIEMISPENKVNAVLITGFKFPENRDVWGNFTITYTPTSEF